MSEERDKSRMEVLKMVEGGQISTGEALQLLAALNGKEPVAEEVLEAEPTTPPADIPQVGDWWIYPTAAGAVVMAIGAPLMALGLSGRTAIFWAICCGWIPFFIGLAVLTIGVWSCNSRWLHLRIRNADTGRMTFALSLPLPLTLAAWVLRMVRPFVPQMHDAPVDELILALKDSLKEEGQPVFIEVQDDGEHVLIYIG